MPAVEALWSSNLVKFTGAIRFAIAPYGSRRVTRYVLAYLRHPRESGDPVDNLFLIRTL